MPNWQQLTRQDWRELTRILVTLVVLAVAATIVLSKGYPEDYTKWAFGALGMVFGYWCK